MASGSAQAQAQAQAQAPNGAPSPDAFDCCDSALDESLGQHTTPAR